MLLILCDDQRGSKIGMSGCHENLERKLVAIESESEAWNQQTANYVLDIKHTS